MLQLWQPKHQRLKCAMSDYVKAIYALANKLGLCDKMSPKEDELHAIVYRVSGKESVKKLTPAESKKVLMELDKLRTDKISKAQHKKAWALFYQLKELSPGTATDGERMAGIVLKVCGKKVKPQKPLQYLDSSEAEKLIEEIKRYIRSAERKSMR